MQLKEVGEFGLIDLIREGTIVNPENIIVGIGDDAAVYLPGHRQLGLLTTDMLVETVHFDLTKTTLWQLGYRAIAVNLSDIAAMGGNPRHAVVSIGLPRQFSVEQVVELYQGMKEICHEFGVNIIGGDTVASPRGMVINVAVVGEVEPVNLLRRSGAKAGDLVVVTGTLGDSACGLDLLLRPGWEEYEFAWPLVTAHLTPRPRVSIGRKLAGWGATSCDDISDGLASEAHELAKASQVGIRLYEERVPLSADLLQAADLLGKAALDYALYGGEDFELVFTIPPEISAELLAAELPFTVVGEVTEPAAGVVLVGRDGQAVLLEAKGYNHFR
ncbi:MAG TPA: thiamine-phosphate kinase [Selenomonadales bacterium]|nr:thiamine-phosphate kinase [Selenomonadales bacterium]